MDNSLPRDWSKSRRIPPVCLSVVEVANLYGIANVLCALGDYLTGVDKQQSYGIGDALIHLSDVASGPSIPNEVREELWGKLEDIVDEEGLLRVLRTLADLCLLESRGWGRARRALDAHADEIRRSI